MNPSNPTNKSGDGAEQSERLQEAKARMKEAGSEAASITKEQLRSRLEEGRASAAAAVDETTAALDDASSRWSAEGHETLAEAAQALAAKLARLADYVETHSLDDVTRDARRIARDNPALMLAGGVALGLALSRFFKASAAHAREGHDEERATSERATSERTTSATEAARRAEPARHAETVRAEPDKYIPGRGMPESDTSMPH